MSLNERAQVNTDLNEGHPANGIKLYREIISLCGHYVTTLKDIRQMLRWHDRWEHLSDVYKLSKEPSFIVNYRVKLTIIS